VYDIVYLSGSIYEVLGMLEGRDTIATSLIHPYMLNLLGVKVEGVLAEFQSENYDPRGTRAGWWHILYLWMCRVIL
jgi:hypothetical protein